MSNRQQTLFRASGFQGPVLCSIVCCKAGLAVAQGNQQVAVGDMQIGGNTIAEVVLWGLDPVDGVLGVDQLLGEVTAGNQQGPATPFRCSNRQELLAVQAWIKQLPASAGVTNDHHAASGHANELGEPL